MRLLLKAFTATYDFEVRFLSSIHQAAHVSPIESSIDPGMLQHHEELVGTVDLVACLPGLSPLMFYLEVCDPRVEMCEQVVSHIYVCL